MNRIVREHYPVSKLPEDLREGLGDAGTVTVVIEGSKETTPSADMGSRQVQSPEAFVEALERIRRPERAGTAIDEAVEEIRRLRDEWDDE